jgi:hypothetical protein
MAEEDEKLPMWDETAVRLFKTRFKTKTQPFAAWREKTVSRQAAKAQRIESRCMVSFETVLLV